jgi:hypothetical protein
VAGSGDQPATGRRWRWRRESGNAMQRMTAKVVGMPADVLSGRRGRPVL